MENRQTEIRTVDLRYYLFRNGGRRKYSDLLWNRFTTISEVKLLSRPLSVVLEGSLVGLHTSPSSTHTMSGSSVENGHKKLTQENGG